MKILTILALLSVVLTGCVKQEDYDALAKKNEKLEQKVEDLEEENDNLRAEIKQLKETLNSVPAQTDTDTAKNTSDDTGIIELYNKTFTNEDSGSAIEILIYYVDGDDKVSAISSYTMPSPSYFNNQYEAEASSALYTSYMIEIAKYTQYFTATTKTDEYYSPILFTNNDNNTGYTFFSFTRNNTPAYSIDDCDWYSEFYDNMNNPQYDCKETRWVIDVFNTIGKEMDDINDLTKEN